MNKRNELSFVADMYKPDIIGITEVKPKTNRYNIQESELTLDGYEIFHNLEERGRGLLLYVKDTLKPSLCQDFTSEYSEKLFVECAINDNESLLIGLIYRSQDDPNAKDNAEKLNKLFEIISTKKATHKLIMGDFNYPQIDWTKETSKAGPDHMATKFLSTVQDLFLIQHQKTPTRYRKGQTPNTLDLVFSNSEELITELRTEAALGKSDHFCLYMELSVTSVIKPPSKRRNYRKTDAEKLKCELAKVSWEASLEEKSVDEAWDFIKEKINDAIACSTPLVFTSGNKSKRFMDKETLESVRTKHRLFRKWNKNKKDTELEKEYIKANNKARKDCRRAHRSYEQKVAEQSKENPKAFYSYANSKIKSRTGIADLLKEDGTKTKTDSEKAEMLNEFFKSVFTYENPGPLPDFDEYEYISELEDFEIKMDEVKKLLSNLNINKATGPDGISPRILSMAAEELAQPITLLFRKSLQSGKLPSEWKMAYVSPIFKKGNKSSVNNYRPVSLTCVVCKIMEKVVRGRVMEHLLSNNLISKHQHGFVPGRSCTTQLLEALDSWTSTLDEGGSVDIVYMDYQKAFDSVPHRRLKMKLSALGIKGHVLTWIEDFLANRKQRVIINNSSSQDADVTSGIPQGSVLGPLLFVAYINDLPRGLKSTAKMFADDTKLYARSDTENGPSDLQDDLNALQEWSRNWLLKFHPQKCCVLKVGKENANEYSMNQILANGETNNIVLKETEKEKDLGVVIDNKLSFKDHVAQQTTKANRIVGLIRRSFDFLSEKMFVILYKSLVRPILEYGHCIWQPSEKGLCIELEKVQKRATKMLGHLKDKPYSDRLKKLKLPSLEYRRLRGDMIETYKYLHGHYDTEYPKFEKTTTTHLRGHSLKIAKQRTRLSIRSNFFSNRITNTWNNLPEQVITAPSVDSFKRRLDLHWKDLPTIFHPTCL